MFIHPARRAQMLSTTTASMRSTPKLTDLDLPSASRCVRKYMILPALFASESPHLTPHSPEHFAVYVLRLGGGEYGIDLLRNKLIESLNAFNR